MFKKKIHIFQYSCYKALQNVIGTTVRQELPMAWHKDREQIKTV